MENFTANKKMKSLTVATALTLATVGTPAFAEEVTPTVDANTDTVVSTTEAPEAEAPKTSADVKSALDVQQAVVNDLGNEALTAMDANAAAQRDLSSAQAQVDAATQAVKDAEANTANATPENIAANQADQAANLADQEANATETDEVNAEIASQTETVADAQTAVDTAQAEKDAADANVAAKEADVKSAQDAISGTGLAEAQANLDQAKADVKTAETNVNTATKAVDTAKQADADRQAKIKAAETDVAVKTDAVNTSKAKLTAAQDAVKQTTDAVTKTTIVVKSAQDAITDIDTVTFTGTKQDIDNFKESRNMWNQNKTDQLWKNTLIGDGVKMAQGFNTTISLADKNQIVDFNALTEEQAQELALYNLQVVNAIRKQLGLPALELNTGSMKAAQDQMDKYVARNKNILTDGHLPGDYFGENGGPIALAKYGTSLTMADVKQNIYDIVMTQAFADAPSNWGHSNNIQKQVSDFGASFGIIAGELYSINVFGVYTGTPIANPKDPATLQAALAKAKAEQTEAQTASDAAKAQLTKASSDYATALEAKTAAEKVLAEATATPLQTQVAENNLRLAEIALTNAQTRQADAQQAVDNFSADLATKKAALNDAKAKLADAQAVQANKATALDAAKAELTKQEATLASLNKDKTALLAEKDRLVEEAQALAAELKGYLEAGTKLEEAKAALSDKKAALKEAITKAKAATNTLEVVNAKLNEAKAKLTELQAEYNKLKDLEDKAKDNVIATLPDGTIVAVPKAAPTVEEKPVLTLSTKKADTPTKTGNNTNQAGITVTQTASGEKVTYSRVARAKALPQTGEQGSLLALFGVAVLSSLGLAGARRKRRS